MLNKLLAACLLLSLAPLATAADRPAARVLLVGIDGCRTDALSAGKVPNLRSLIKEGALSTATRIVGPRDDAADTVSGPGWSNVLTGVWADKHGVLDNNFRVTHYEQFPCFFRHLKDTFAGARTYAYCTWPPIDQKIITAADDAQHFLDDDKSARYRQADDKCTRKVVEVLEREDPDALFFYLGAVDEAGHQFGFHPGVPEYMAALDEADAQLGRVLSALHARPKSEEEHWLVLVGTDHGGRGKDHGGGRDVAEINTVWLIVSGPAAARGEIAGPTAQVDLVATALAHLGVPLRPEWKLDGRAVGLAKATQE